MTRQTYFSTSLHLIGQNRRKPYKKLAFIQPLGCCHVLQPGTAAHVHAVARIDAGCWLTMFAHVAQEGEYAILQALVAAGARDGVTGTRAVMDMN